jgi:hypothetical protein
MNGGGTPALWILYVAVAVFMLVAMWKVYDKAGQPGWAAIIPIYNIWVLLRIVGKPEWWLLLFFVPIVNIVVSVLVYIALAERFGKDSAFAVGMVFLPFIFFPILGFGTATYRA